MNIRTAIILAGVILLVAFGAAAMGLDDDTQRRIQGFNAGLVLAIFANSIPKQLPPFRSSARAARTQSYQRFAGWTFAIAGLGHALLWLVAPIPIANTMSMILVGSAVILVFVTCVLARALLNAGETE